jgi:hypothetical protein
VRGLKEAAGSAERVQLTFSVACAGRLHYDLRAA